MHAEIIETRIIEITKNGFIRGMVHGLLMLGVPPHIRFGPMTAGASFAADKGKVSGDAGRKVVAQNLGEKSERTTDREGDDHGCGRWENKKASRIHRSLSAMFRRSAVHRTSARIELGMRQLRCDAFDLDQCQGHVRRLSFSSLEKRG